jgi:prepilin-type N-terminal cleavage/methylation domain-containing protein
VSSAQQRSRGSAQDPQRCWRDDRAGFSLIEVLIAILLVALVYAVAVPSLASTRVRAAVHNSKHVVLSSISLARSSAIRFGRPAVLVLDSRGDRIWVEVDTALVAGGPKDTLNLVDLGQELDVDLKSNRSSVCFNGRGIGTTGAACPWAGGLIIVSSGSQADTVLLSPVGRVVRR